MIMIDHSKRLSQPLRWGARERIAVMAALGALALASLALVAYGLTSGAPARADCIDITFAGTLGASKIHACGGRARTICSSSGEYAGLRAQLQEACRGAGFRYGAASKR